MAFQQPQRPRPTQRQRSFTAPVVETIEARPESSHQRKRALEDSQEWVLFSPSVNADSTAHTQTTSTERTPRTAGLSRLSDFGSLDTAAQSDQYGEDDEQTQHGSEADDDNEELDSLDEGLHAFHEPSGYNSPVQTRLEQSGDTVLPTHDGLGSFQANSFLVREQISHFERFRPRNKSHVRRRSSVQRRLDALEDAEMASEQDEKTQRIERWRIDQSRALLEEIERETRRRRRMSMASAARNRADSVHQESATEVSEAQVPADGMEVGSTVNAEGENDSWWQRFTRKVIRDLMGIDESLLSVIFGEALPEDIEQELKNETESRPTISGEIQSVSRLGDSWEHRLLEKIAHELGIMVNQLTDHSGAFSTYLRTQEPTPYAGITASTPPTRMETSATISSPHPTTKPTSTSATFNPTLPHQHTATAYSEASLWGIDEESPSHLAHQIPEDVAQRLQQEREYWERELDVKMVFNFLRKRFSSRASSPEPYTSTLPQPPPSSTYPTNPLSARRAALIRQHHPLAARATAERDQAQQQQRRRDLLHRHHAHHQKQPPSAVLRSPRFHGRQGSSSCASQSTKKSKRSGSSRNYWDIGAGSVGSGPANGVGNWGEV